MKAQADRVHCCLPWVFCSVAFVAGLFILPAELDAQPPQFPADSACWAEIRIAQEDSTAVNWQRAYSCIHSTDSSRKEASLKLADSVIRYTGELMWTIPEYHDEQRLRNGPNHFGPVAYIYAVPTLGGFTSRDQFAEHGPRGVLVGVVSVLRHPVTEQLPPSYMNMGLDWGLNCVWLIHDPNIPPPGAWTGRVAPADPNTLRCDPQAAGKVHPVRRTRFRRDPALASTAFRFEDYPPVARFGETDAATPLLGFKCVDAWCELGPGAMSPASTIAVGLTANGVGRREVKIPGWHDEQVLSERVVPGRFVPAVKAKIVPAPRMDTLRLADFISWTPVATIKLETDPAPGSKYARWGLRGGAGIRGNVLELMRNGATWQVRVIPLTATGPGAPRQWNFVERHEHLDAAVPATVRFRWTVADDGIWVPCGQGCCKAEGPQG